LNISSPQAGKFAEITGLVPFSTATPDFVNPADSLRHKVRSAIATRLGKRQMATREGQS